MQDTYLLLVELFCYVALGCSVWNYIITCNNGSLFLVGLCRARVSLQPVSQSSINVPNVAFETLPVSPGLTVVLLRAGRMDELRSTSCWTYGRVTFYFMLDVWTSYVLLHAGRMDELRSTPCWTYGQVTFYFVLDVWTSYHGSMKTASK